MFEKLKDKVRARLIDDWKSAWRYASVWLSGLIAMVATAYEYMPQLQQYLPAGWFKYAVLVIIFARIWRQQKPTK